MSGRGQAGSGSSAQMTLAQERQPQQQCKPPVGHRQRRLRLKPATSLAVTLYDGVGDNRAQPVCSWETVRCKTPGHVITVGTECSGLESVMAALDHMGLGGQTRLRFVCEKDASARKLILPHQQPDLLYEDITQRPVSDMPTCDLYAAGFPCRPWSSAGLRGGPDYGHGRIFRHIVDYLFHKTPKCFLLENVQV